MGRALSIVVSCVVTLDVGTSAGVTRQSRGVLTVASLGNSR